MRTTRSTVRLALLPALFLAALAVPWSSGRGAAWIPTWAEARAAADLVGTAMRIESLDDWIQPEWTVRNQGTGAASGTWFDSLYISPSSTCCAGAILLGTTLWSSPVDSGTVYKQRIAVQVPPLPLGNYYLIARINAAGSLAESDRANNDIAVPFRIAPNVRFETRVTVPASATTQQPIEVSWTVANGSFFHPEDATAELWLDSVYISRGTVCCAGATFLGSWPHTGGLRVNREYTQTQVVSVPSLPAGDYYVIVVVDATNAQPREFEFSQGWAPLGVKTPDLAPAALHAGTAPTASTQQPISVSWTVANRGSGPTVAPWQDDLYLSASPACCDGALRLGSWPAPSSLVPGGSYSPAKSLTVPNLDAGRYYLTLWTNATGTLHEERAQDNQLTIPFTVTTPDLEATALTAPNAGASGQAVAVTWTVRNAGTGPTVGTWADELYLSPTTACCAGATLLGRWERSALAAGSSYTQAKTVAMPGVPAGSYYMILRSDSDDALFEASEANNQRAIGIAVTTPDLVATALAAPASATTQQAVSVSWTVRNQGTATTSRTWIDQLYLSPTPGCCAGAVLLGQWPWLAAVAPGASYSQTKTVTIPAIDAGAYHLVLIADAPGTLPEVSEANNQRAVPIDVRSPDLAPTVLAAPATAEAGRAVSVSWTVRNQGAGAAPGTWADRLYLSAGEGCCAGNTVLGSWSRPTALGPGASYAQAKTITLPALAAGTYRLTLWTDADGQVHESSDANNQRAVTIDVSSTSIPPPAVLAVASVNAGVPPSASTTFAVLIEARDLGGIRRSVAAATTVRLALKSGSGVLGGPLTATMAAGTSQITLAGLTYRKAEPGIVLTASRTAGDVLTSGSSAAFAVMPGAIASYVVSAPVAIAAGQPVAVTATARDQHANVVTTDSTTVVTLRSSASRVLFDAGAGRMLGEVVGPLVAGVLRVNAQGVVAGAASVVASDAAGKTGSASLTVTAGPASALVFTTQPAGAPAGAVLPGPPTVAVRDAFGNPVAASLPISLAIGSNPGSGALGGTTTKSATAGVVSFANLAISQPGSGYTLVATAAGLSPATTSPFTITSTTGGIGGHVRRQGDGAPVVAATVEALLGGLVRGSVSSGADGAYSVSGLAPGTYTVRASAGGFEPRSQAFTAVTAGATATVDFSLPAAAGAAIRITSPTDGATVDRGTLLVQGEVTAPPGTEIGVAVNGVAGLVGSGRFAALVPLDPGTQVLTATLRNASVTLAIHEIGVYVAPDPAAARVFLTASPRTGAAPLTVALRAAAGMAVSAYRWDIDGDGVIDDSGAALDRVDVQYTAPGLYVPSVMVSDALGAQVFEQVPVVVLAQASLQSALETKWRQFKDALRSGNVAGALQYVAESRREHYRKVFDHLTVPLSQIDLILTDLRFVQIRDNTAEFEMLRSDERGRMSYLVRFVLDTDGIWRLKDF